MEAVSSCVASAEQEIKRTARPCCFDKRFVLVERSATRARPNIGYKKTLPCCGRVVVYLLLFASATYFSSAIVIDGVSGVGPAAARILLRGGCNKLKNYVLSLIKSSIFDVLRYYSHTKGFVRERGYI